MYFLFIFLTCFGSPYLSAALTGIWSKQCPGRHLGQGSLNWLYFIPVKSVYFVSPSTFSLLPLQEHVPVLRPLSLCTGSLHTVF